MMETNGGKDDLKTQFITREGCYRLLNLSEYSRPNRVGYQSNQNSPQVHVSFVSLPNPSATQNFAQQQQQSSSEKGKKERVNVCRWMDGKKKGKAKQRENSCTHIPGDGDNGLQTNERILIAALSLSLLFRRSSRRWK
jgi:hypothetical protein